MFYLSIALTVFTIINLFLLYPYMKSVKFEEKLKNPYNDLERNFLFHFLIVFIAIMPFFNLYFFFNGLITIVLNKKHFNLIQKHPEIAVIYRLERCFYHIHAYAPEAKVIGAPDHFTWKRKSSLVLVFLKKHQNRQDVSKLLIRCEPVINLNLKSLTECVPATIEEQRQIAKNSRFSLEPLIEEVRLLYVSEPSNIEKYKQKFPNNQVAIPSVPVHNFRPRNNNFEPPNTKRF